MAGTGDYAFEQNDAMKFLVGELQEIATTSNVAARRLGLRVGAGSAATTGFPRWSPKSSASRPTPGSSSRTRPRSRTSTGPSTSVPSPSTRSAPSATTAHYTISSSHTAALARSSRACSTAPTSNRCAAARSITPAGEFEVLSGYDPLRHYASTTGERCEIARLAQDKHAGDIILFGAYDPERNSCTCFDDQVGAHGAMGGSQYWPFLLTPAGLVPPDQRIEGPLDIHTLLARYRASG
jgi:hypothetical protein